MDRRQQKTRKAVFEAFTALLERKPYSKISVQEIIDGANIGRSTFYAHFETKDELLKELCKEIFDHVFSEHLERETTHDFSAREKDLEAEVTHVLYHLGDNRIYLRSILSCESGEMFMQYFKAYLVTLFQSQVEQQPTDVPKDYLLNRMVCDFAETVRWWMANDGYSAEEVSRFFLSAAPCRQGKQAANAPLVLG